jgi:hypothetical protein
MAVTSFIQLYIHTHYPFKYTLTHSSFIQLYTHKLLPLYNTSIHLYISLSLHLYIYLYIYTSHYLYIYTSIHHLYSDHSIHSVQLYTFCSMHSIRLFSKFEFLREREREMDRSYLPSAKAERSVIDNGGDIASLQVEKPVQAQHIQQQVRVHRARSVTLRYAFFLFFFV